MTDDLVSFVSFVRFVSFVTVSAATRCSVTVHAVEAAAFDGHGLGLGHELGLKKSLLG